MLTNLKGVGKTSLIKAIVQICEDIVHVDPLAATPVSIPESRRRSSKGKRSGSVDMQTTTQITEVYASTRAYPSWWSDIEESRVLRRRKSMGDSVLERNLCFVDTPGYGKQASVSSYDGSIIPSADSTQFMESITPIVDYIEAQFKKTSAFEDLGESETINMLSGNGGSQVDVVLYMISSSMAPEPFPFSVY